MILSPRIATIGLAAASVLFAAIIGIEVSDWQTSAIGNGRDLAAPVRQAAPRASPSEPDQHAEWLKQIRARPLFNPERRPVETGVTGLPRLAGIVLDGSHHVAIFAGPSNGNPVLAEAGARVGAYEVRSIGDEGVTVIGPDGATVLRPSFDRTRPQGNPAVPLPSRAPNRK